MSEVRVTGLNIYPIKSCGGIELDSSRITQTGLEHDRKFMLIDEGNKFISQRKLPNGPSLARVVTEIKTYSGPLEGKSNGRLGVGIEGHGDIELSLFLPPHHRDTDVLPKDAERIKLDLVEATLHNTKVTGAVVSGEANEFFSDYLGEPVRLLRVVESVPRQISEAHRIDGTSNITGFADGYSILLTSQKSLEELNEHPEIEGSYELGVPMGRFRPNIVVSGEDLVPYDEDYWRKIKLGRGVTAFVVKPCVRCQIPDTDQKSGNIGKEVRRVLAVTRRGSDITTESTGTFFGQNLNHVHKAGARIAVGDIVEVVARSDVPNISLRTNQSE